MTPAEYLEAARRIESDRRGLAPLRLAVLSTFTAELLRPYLVVEAADRGLGLELSFGPPRPLEQQVLDPEDVLRASAPDVVWLAARLEDLAPAVFEAPEKLDELRGRLRSLLEELRKAGAATLLVSNFVEPDLRPLGALDAAAVVQRCNEALAGLAAEFPGVFVYDQARLSLELGLEACRDAKLRFLAGMPYSVPAQVRMAGRLARMLKALLVPPAKCLVVDLDDTLWGGAVGEVGVEGLQLGGGYPGNAFKEFQRQLAALRGRGVLLAAASKNDPEDARRAFEEHPDMVLSWADFSARQVGWEDKASGLRKIAEALRVGLDSLVFFDDDPAEREWVRSQLPEVRVVDVPPSPLDFAQALDDCGHFDSLAVSEADRRRPQLYEQDERRAASAARTKTVEEFLRDLDMRAEVGPLNRSALARAAQLVNRTSQFNLTARRQTEAGLAQLMAGGGLGFYLRVADRFGDSGLVGAAFAAPEAGGKAWRIDPFVLSCRVLGRRLETVFLRSLMELVREAGGARLLGRYVPSPKNRNAADFYAAHGFRRESDDWAFDLAAELPAAPDFISVRVSAR